MSDVPRIDEALLAALDFIADDEEYADARRELLSALDALTDGTTAQVRAHLDEGLRLIDAACPI